VQKMARELDAGDIVAQREVSIAEDDTARELRPRLIALGAQLLADTLPTYLNGGIARKRRMPLSRREPANLRKKTDCSDLNASAQENWNKYRAYADTIGTYFYRDDERIKITQASIQGCGVFTIERVIPEGKREIQVSRDYL
jgi:methionyl-tRNA formyltransferase